MALTVKLTCGRHPRYKASRPPKTKCWGCERLWMMTRPERFFSHAGQRWYTRTSVRVAGCTTEEKLS